MFLWDKTTHGLLTQYNMFVISRVKSTPCSKGILSAYVRVMVMEGMHQGPVRWAAQTTTCVLAVAGGPASETLVEAEEVDLPPSVSACLPVPFLSLICTRLRICDLPPVGIW